jgi:cytochrome c oxidase subunit II
MRAGRPLPTGGNATRRSTRRTAWLGWLLLAVLVLALAGCADNVRVEIPGHVTDQNALRPEGPMAAAADRLWNIVFPIAVGVFVLVQGLLLYAVFKFRARGDDLRPPRQVAGNTRLEIMWTAIPALILVVVAVPTVQTIFAVAGEPETGERLDVRVIAKQYWWEFEYPDDGVITANELHIPVDRPVYLQMEALSASVPDPGEVGVKTGPVAEGVIHSFWVPRLAGKQDVVPGHVRTLRIEATEAGARYSGQCAEFCGLSHPNMRFQVVTHTEADFSDWLEQQAQPAAEPADGLAAQGAELFSTAQCYACHVLNGHPDSNPATRIAPDLTHFATREMFAGGIFNSDDTEQIKRWIENPQREKPGAQMAAFPNLSDEDLEALAAYLQSLQ